MKVSDAITQRFSARGFKPDPVPVETVREILALARHAPSGGNLQPWRVYALAGQALADLKHLVDGKLSQGLSGDPPEYDIYPPKLWEPYRSRRREAGALRYAAIGVTEKSESGWKLLEQKNYSFFNAPVGLFFCIDRKLGSPQWSDLGMFMQNIMLLAVERGLDTCPQESWSNWAATVRGFLKIPDEFILFSGMSMGYRDDADPLNNFRTPRETLDSFAEFIGF